jgi:hypothetical protein
LVEHHWEVLLDSGKVVVDVDVVSALAAVVVVIFGFVVVAGGSVVVVVVSLEDAVDETMICCGTGTATKHARVLIKK